MNDRYEVIQLYGGIDIEQQVKFTEGRLVYKSINANDFIPYSLFTLN